MPQGPGALGYARISVRARSSISVPALTQPTTQSWCAPALSARLPAICY